MIGKPSEDCPHYVDEQKQADLQSAAMWSHHYQEAYQASLGRFLVRFNELEMAVSSMLQMLTTNLGVPHLYRPKEYYVQQLDRLELALCARPQWPKPDFDKLREMNGVRNQYAHGVLMQNPNTGDYETLPLRQSGKGSTSRIIEPEMIDKDTDRVIAALQDVQRLWPWIAFGDTPVQVPEGAAAPKV